MGRASKPEHEKLDERAFRRLFFSRIRPALLRAALCYTYLEPPPWARGSDGKAVPGLLGSNTDTAQWFDQRMGNGEDRAIAAAMWALNERMRIAARVNGTSAYVSNVASVTYRDIRLDGADYAVPLRVSMPSMSPTRSVPNNHYSMSPASNEFLGWACPEDHAYFAPANDEEDTAVRQWAMAMLKRRHEAHAVLCFIGMWAENEELSTAQVLRHFPWLRAAFEMLGVQRGTIAESFVQWRGHDAPLVQTMRDGKPSATAPWERGAVLAWATHFGEKVIEPALAQMVLAKQFYSERHPRKPQDVFTLGSLRQGPYVMAVCPSLVVRCWDCIPCAAGATRPPNTPSADPAWPTWAWELLQAMYCSDTRD